MLLEVLGLNVDAFDSDSFILFIVINAGCSIFQVIADPESISPLSATLRRENTDFKFI
jgi:hypothetical protein